MRGAEDWVHDQDTNTLADLRSLPMTFDNSTATSKPQAPMPEIVAAPPDPHNEMLHRPVSFDAKYGEGKRQTLVLGGGGVYFVAWQVAYLNGLMRRGVDLEGADMIVGTSAGSLVASILASRGLNRFGKEVKFLSKRPSLVHLLAPADNFQHSQVRALELFRDADNAHPDTIREIGYASLAAHTPSAAELRRSTGFAIASRGWPSPALHITAVDTYTGERLVVTHESQVSAVRAAAASSAVPGIFSPQPIHDRLCMDGGVSGTGTHCDLVAGSDKAIVIALGAGMDSNVATMTLSPNSFATELSNLQACGTKTFARGPEDVDLERLMDPLAVPEAIEMGEAQAEADAEEVRLFWGRS